MSASALPPSTHPRELERKLIESVVAKLEVTRLPGMPIIIDRALRASRRERDASQLCEWLALDPSLAFRVFEATAGPAARAGSDELSLAQRVGAMKPELARSLLMSAARCSLGPDPAPLSARELGEFWIHALRVAFLSRTLAEACSYRNPDEAYLAGLLHDFGSFALLATVPNTLRSLVATQANAPWGAIPEHAGRLGTIHAQIGAALLERLRVPFYVSDALLLHHAPSAELEGTHPLVRILCCAEALAHSRSPAVARGAIADLLETPASAVSSAEKAAAEKVSAVLRGLGRLGLTKPQAGRAGPADAVAPSSGAEQRLTETLVMRFVKEAQQPATGDAPLERESDRESERGNEPGDDAAEEQGWSEALALHGTNATAGAILDQIVGEAVQLEARTLLRQAENVPLAFAEVLPLARVVAGVKCAALFLAGDDPDRNLPGWLVGSEGAQRVELELSPSGQSLVARAARAGNTVTSYEEGKASQLAGLDLQIARMLGAEEITAIPLKGGGAPNRGVVVFGSSAMKASRFAEVLPFLSNLVELVTRTLSERRAGAAADRSGQSAEQMRASTRRLVHEARNPLSVLKTYLQIARTRAEGGASLEKELKIANQEVERVARLLDEIGSPDEAAAPRVRPVEVNRMIEDLLLLYGEALFAEKKIALSPMLDASILPIFCDEEGLKQVLLNLLINASEALSSDGQVLVCTSDHVNYEGKVMVEISVADNGPGMPPEKVAGLFAPSAEETKDAARGIGLPTSLAVVKAMGGHLVCRSRLGEGTTFAILLPRSAGADPRSSVSAVA
ncbi:MAG TPA: HDOD domain-containing protein [Burkholderiales bacterium]|nr:HDOD domain-containing protein [Burkholderiales bacterium]